MSVKQIDQTPQRYLDLTTDQIAVRIPPICSNSFGMCRLEQRNYSRREVDLRSASCRGSAGGKGG